MNLNKPAVLFAVVAIALMTVGAALQLPPQAPIVLKGAPMGAVKFAHVAHLKVAGKCDICHHASKPLKPLSSPQQACTDCHTRPPTPPVVTGLPAAFHNAAATAGLCIDCHRRQNAAGKAAPTKCEECHQKDNG